MSNHKPFKINNRVFSNVKSASHVDGEVGRYKKTRTGVYLYVNGELVAYACDRKHFTGLVTAFHFDGMVRYMFAATSKLESDLGFDQLTMSQKTEAVSVAIKELNDG